MRAWWAHTSQPTQRGQCQATEWEKTNETKEGIYIGKSPSAPFVLFLLIIWVCMYFVAIFQPNALALFIPFSFLLLESYEDQMRKILAYSQPIQ